MSITERAVKNPAGVAVETGIGLGGPVQVTGNINQGARIITRGGERLQPGQTVTTKES